MEQILNLILLIYLLVYFQFIKFRIKQLYNENEDIRKLSEQQLNYIFNDVDKIRIGFDYLCNQNFEKSLKLQFFIFLKHYIQQNYLTILVNHQNKIQQILLFYLDKVDSQIIPLLCKLINFTILNSPDPNTIIIQIMGQNRQDIPYISLITEMMNDQFIKLRLKYSRYKINFIKIINLFAINDLYLLDVLLNLYISLTNSLFYSLSDEENITIITQYCQFISNLPQQSIVLDKFSKIIFRLIIRKNLSELIQQQLFQNIIHNYLLNQNHLKRITAYRILKILKQLFTFQKINHEIKQKMIIFIVTNTIQLDIYAYQNLCLNQEEDIENDYYLQKIRNFGLDLVISILQSDQQNHLFHEILQISDQLISLNSDKESDDCIKKETHYYIISSLLNYIPIHQIDQLFLQELLCCLKKMSNIYIPIKIQVLTLIKKLTLKQTITNSSQVNYLLSILKDQMQYAAQINNPNLLCAIIDLLINLQLFFPQKICITQQTYKDLIQFYSFQHRIIYKQNILKCMVQLESQNLGNNSIIAILESEFSSSKSEQHFYKYQFKMLIDTMNCIVNTWSSQQLSLVQDLIFQLVYNCLKQFKHQLASLNLFNFLLIKLLNHMEIKSLKIEHQIRQLQYLFLDCLDEEPEILEVIIQAYYLILLHDVGDLKPTLLFLIKYLAILKNKNYLSLFCLFLFRLKQDIFQQEIQQLFTILFEGIEQDEGRLCSELLCGLSILDRNQYDIKEIMLVQLSKIMYALLDVIDMMIYKAINYIRCYNRFYINYLISFAQSMIFKQHLIFDMAQLSLKNNYLIILKELLYQSRTKEEESCYSLINQIQKIFEMRYSSRMYVIDSIIKKFQFSIDISIQDDINMNELKLS